MQVQLSSSGRWYYANYDTFSLYSEDNKYALRLSGFCGNAGDSLSNTTIPYPGAHHNGMSFTTSDADNDGCAYGNCAITWPAGWWFDNCYACCLTCRYQTDFQWYIYSDWETYGLLRAARMMIKIRWTNATKLETLGILSSFNKYKILCLAVYLQIIYRIYTQSTHSLCLRTRYMSFKRLYFALSKTLSCSPITLSKLDITINGRDLSTADADIDGRSGNE